MKTHTILMVAMAALAVGLIAFAPSLGVTRGFGLIFLICPLMMMVMMVMMVRNGEHK